MPDRYWGLRDMKPFRDVWIGLLDAEGNEPTAESYKRVPCRLLLGLGMYLNARPVEIGPIGKDWGQMEWTAIFGSAGARKPLASLITKVKIPDASRFQADDWIRWEVGQVTISFTLGKRPLAPEDLN